MQSTPYVLWFNDIDTRDTLLVGKNSRNLAEMTQAGFPVVPGFTITSSAYFDFLKENKLDHKIKQLLTTVNFERPETVMQITQHIEKMFADAHMSSKFHTVVQPYFEQLGATSVKIHAYTHSKDMSKHLEDIAEDYNSLASKVKDAWAAHFSGKLLAHRNTHLIDQVGTGMEIIIQKIIQPKNTGILYTMDKNSHGKERIIIQTSFPHKADRYEVSKKTLMILDRTLEHTMRAPKLTLEAIQTLAKLGRDLEIHRYFPQEIDWAMTKDKVYIVATKPITTVKKDKQEVHNKHAAGHGTTITSTVATGVVKIIKKTSDLQTVRKDDIVVIDTITPSTIPYLKKAKAILCTAAIHHPEITAKLRQSGIPTLYHVNLPKNLSKNGTLITVHAGKGKIYAGGL